MWPAAWRPRSNIELRKTSFCRAEADCWMLFINTMLQSRSGIASPDVIFSFRTPRQVRRRLKSRTDESRQCRILGHLIEQTFLLQCLGNNVFKHLPANWDDNGNCWPRVYCKQESRTRH